MLNSLVRKFSKLSIKSIAEIPKLKPQPIKDKSEVESILKANSLTGWQANAQNSAIEKSLEFKDFLEAMSFMNTVAIFAERIQHHPDWYNVYNRVRITLNTHDAPGISMKDFYLAKYINLVAEKVRKSGAKQTTQIVEIADDEFLK